MNYPGKGDVAYIQHFMVPQLESNVHKLNRSQNYSITRKESLDLFGKLSPRPYLQGGMPKSMNYISFTHPKQPSVRL